MLSFVPEIQHNLSSLLKMDGSVDIGLHIGIHMGTVIAGEIGSEEKKEYTELWGMLLILHQG